jgi:hypothetical protein
VPWELTELMVATMIGWTGAEKKLPLAQEPLPGSFAGSVLALVLERLVHQTYFARRLFTC